MKKNGMPKQGIAVRGCFRLQIANPDGKIVGSSGWRKNQVTDLGFNLFVVSLLGKIAGSSQIGAIALGTGSVPGAAATSLNGEITHSSRSRVSTDWGTLTYATSSGSKTLRLTGTFASANSFVTAAANISNIGLYAASVTAAGTLFAGNTYASSTVATNQQVNVTYDLIFATA